MLSAATARASADRHNLPRWMTGQPRKEIQAAGQGVFTITENSHGRIMTGMISPDAQAAGLRGILRHEGRRGIIRVIDGTPTLITSPLLIRQRRGRELFEMLVSVPVFAGVVTGALTLFHVQPVIGFFIGLTVGFLIWSGYTYSLRPRRVASDPWRRRIAAAARLATARLRH